MSDTKPKNLPPIETRFKPGQSGNPGGYAKGARNRIQGKFLNDLAEHYEEHGKRAIQRCYEEDPVAYVKVVAALLPKQVEETKPIDEMTDAEIVAGIAWLRGRLAENAPSGAAAPSEPSQTH